MPGKKGYWLYRFTRRAASLFIRRPVFTGLENLPQEPCVVVANHCQTNGPVIAEVYFPGRRSIWCASEMMIRDQVADYAFRDFWSFKPRWTHGFYRLLAHAIVPVSVAVFNNAHCIPVHRDARIIETFRQTIARLSEGDNIIIFPERNEKHNHIVYAFHEGFVDVARFYHRKTGKALCFVPMYLAPKLRRAALGAPMRYRPEAPLSEERARITSGMMDAITRLAEAMPPHTVIPYRNIPRRYYPKNRPQEDAR